MTQLLLPALLAVMERPGEFEPGVRRRALGIAHSTIPLVHPNTYIIGANRVAVCHAVAQVAQLLLPALLVVVERPGEIEPGVRRRALGSRTA